MSRISTSQPITLLDNVSSTGESAGFLVQDYRHVVLAVGTSNSANLTLQMMGSINGSDDEPDWSSSASETNLWSFVAVKDLEDQSTIDGDTGIVLSGSDDTFLVEVNTNGLNWLAVDVTSRSAGNITVIAQAYGN